MIANEKETGSQFNSSGSFTTVSSPPKTSGETLKSENTRKQFHKEALKTTKETYEEPPPELTRRLTQQIRRRKEERKEGRAAQMKAKQAMKAKKSKQARGVSEGGSEGGSEIEVKRSGEISNFGEAVSVSGSHSAWEEVKEVRYVSYIVNLVI